MNETIGLIFAGLGGVGVGAVFFGGLWWTVNVSVHSQRPALWMFGSLIVRVGLALAAFYLLGGAHWQRLLACLLGFFVARVIVMRFVPLLERYRAGHPVLTRESRHAP